MRSRGGDLQPGAFGSGDEFATGAVHFDAQLADVFANFRAGFDDGLVHLLFDLLDDVRRRRGDELHYMRAEFTCGRVNDLKFFFYADGKAVSHGVALRVLGCGDSQARIILRCMSKLHYYGAHPAGTLS